MDSANLNERLSRISTQWTMVFNAHGAPGQALPAQRALLERYGRAVFRYLLGAVRDADVAEELAQEFALRFVRGDFRWAAPERGRFRNYLKTSLVHMVTDYHRQRQAAPARLNPEAPEPAAPSEASEVDFAASWREEILEQTWQALGAFNPTYRAALFLRVQEPDLTSNVMSERLTAELGKPISAALVRKALQRAHEKFADLLLEEVAGSLEDAGPEELENELRELDLLRYCRSALERRGK
jgi:RNA polymerase sigma factor (sigma-70 family)